MKKIGLILFLLNAIGPIQAQVSLIGATCVSSGISYKYLLSGITGQASGVQVCVTGGIITGNDSICKNGLSAGFFEIVWDTSSQGSINISGMSGSAVLQVNKARVFLPGKIEPSSLVQLIRPGELSKVVICEAPMGGGCSANYKYQWQRSTDSFNWSDITGATSKDLLISNINEATGSYRRKVVDMSSNTESYSGNAIISIAQ